MPLTLGIDLRSGPAARQRWFLAAILYGARISGQLAGRTYQVFAARGIYTPEAILAQGWDNLVVLLDQGGYARYDFKTATKLLRVMAALQEQYQGSLERLHDLSRSYADLESRLRGLGAGIGPTTVNIFLRELRGIWDRATPPLSPLAQQAGEHLGLFPPGLTPEAALEALTLAWQAQPEPGYDLADLEAALVRLGLALRRRRRPEGGVEPPTTIKHGKERHARLYLLPHCGRGDAGRAGHGNPGGPGLSGYRPGELRPYPGHPQGALPEPAGAAGCPVDGDGPGLPPGGPGPAGGLAAPRDSIST